MYYIVETHYVGPNPQEHLNDAYVYITTDPPRTIGSNKLLTDGWLGSYGDWSSDAYGEYESLPEARAEAEYIWSEIGLWELDLDDPENEFFADPGTVVCWQVGAFEQMGPEETLDFVSNALPQGDECRDWTDDDIDRYVEELQREVEEDAQLIIHAETVIEELQARRGRS